MLSKKKLNDYAKGYDFIEDLSGKSIINLLKTVEIMQFVYDSLFDRYNISAPKFSAMLLLYQKKDEGMLLSEIGDEMLVTRANITGLMDRMEKEGLIEKRPNERDKRSTIAFLTDKGKNIYESVREDHIKFSNEMTNALSDAEKTTLNVYLEKLQQDIIDYFGEDGK